MSVNLFEGTEAEALLTQAELGRKLAKAEDSLARLKLRKKGFLNHHEQHYVDTNIRRLTKRIAKIEKKMEATQCKTD